MVDTAQGVNIGHNSPLKNTYFELRVWISVLSTKNWSSRSRETSETRTFARLIGTLTSSATPKLNCYKALGKKYPTTHDTDKFLTSQKSLMLLGLRL